MSVLSLNERIDYVECGKYDDRNATHFRRGETGLQDARCDDEYLKKEFRHFCDERAREFRDRYRI